MAVIQQTLAAGLVRALVLAVVLAGSAFFGQLQSGSTVRAAGIAAGVAFFAALVLRLGEAGYDVSQSQPQAVKQP